MNERNGCVATIGFFDGVHRGHRYLIEQVRHLAETTGRKSMVVTFDCHPRQVLHSDYQPRLLSTLDIKLLLLSRLHINMVEVLHFDESTAQMPAYDFMRDILQSKYDVDCLVLGYDNRFGKRAEEESFDDYVRYGKKLGMEVIRATELPGDVHVSSSHVRRLLTAGDIEEANRCLGYQYTIVGKVVNGEQNGRQMGFPTANIDTTEWGQLMPAAGVYAVRIRRKNGMQQMRGMMNIGHRPTFDGIEQTAEVNIFDFRDNLYGETLLVTFVWRIREERRFDSPELLAKQLDKDKTTIIEMFNKETER